MKSKHIFFTKTLGDFYLKQGYYQDAEKVFKTLLAKEPGRSDYLSALTLCEKNLKIEENLASGDLNDLVRCWAGLLNEERRKAGAGQGR
jgi:tetratricopeptide (TPR) repeat protein